MPYDNPTTYEIHTYDDWSALYIDGKYITEGHEYNITEKVFSLLGIEVVQDDAFMRGAGGRDTAVTLEEVSIYRAERDDKLRRAEELRREAEGLVLQAKELESEAKGAVKD